MRKVSYFGVPVGNLSKANRLTIPGSLRDVARYKFVQDENRGAAIASVATAIDRYTQPAASNPYVRAGARQIYASHGLSGLGDMGWGGGSYGANQSEFASDTPPKSTSGSDSSGPSGWFGVLNTFVGNISQGLAAKIGGWKGPTGAPTNYPTPAPSFPILPVAALGLGGIVIYKLMSRGRRKSRA